MKNLSDLSNSEIALALSYCGDINCNCRDCPAFESRKENLEEGSGSIQCEYALMIEASNRIEELNKLAEMLKHIK